MFGRILNGHEQFQEQMHGALDRRDDGLQWAQKVLNKKEQLRDAWDDVAKMVHRTKKSHNVWMFLLFSTSSGNTGYTTQFLQSGPNASAPSRPLASRPLATVPHAPRPARATNRPGAGRVEPSEAENAVHRPAGRRALFGWSLQRVGRGARW